MKRIDVEQNLDNVLGVEPSTEDSSVHAFYVMYMEEAAKVGFRLDYSGNRNKVQPPDNFFTALGVEICTNTFTWSYKADKLALILNTMNEMVEREEMEFTSLQSVMGTKRREVLPPLLPAGRKLRPEIDRAGAASLVAE